MKDATDCHVSSAKITVTISFKCSRHSAFSAHSTSGYDLLWEVQDFEIPMLNCEFVPQTLDPARESFSELRIYPSHIHIPTLAKESFSLTSLFLHLFYSLSLSPWAS